MLLFRPLRHSTRLYHAKGKAGTLRSLRSDSFESEGTIQFPRQKAIAHPSPDPQRQTRSKKNVEQPHRNYKHFPADKDAAELTQARYQAKFMHELEPWLDHGACDFVLDIRDARLPFSTENKRLAGMIRHIPRIVVFNRCDLSDPTYERPLLDFYTRHNIPCLFTDAKRGHNMRALLDAIRSLPVFNNFDRPVVGLALGFTNVGKTSVVSRLRQLGRSNYDRELMINPLDVHKRIGEQKFSLHIDRKPGTTRMMNATVISREPVVVLHDTPGLSYPNLTVQEELALKYTSCMLNPYGAKRRGVTLEMAMSYLLQHIMNRPVPRSRLLAHLCLDESDVPTMAATPYHIFRRIHTMHMNGRKHGGMDMRDIEGTVGLLAAKHIEKLFSRGALGQITLDTLPYDLDSLTTDLVPSPEFKPAFWDQRQSVAFHTDTILAAESRAGTTEFPEEERRGAVGTDGIALPRSMRTYGSWQNRDTTLDKKLYAPHHYLSTWSSKVPLVSSSKSVSDAAGAAGRGGRFPWQRGQYGSAAKSEMARKPEASRAVSAGMVGARTPSERAERGREREGIHPDAINYQFH